MVIWKDGESITASGLNIIQIKDQDITPVTNGYGRTLSSRFTVRSENDDTFLKMNKNHIYFTEGFNDHTMTSNNFMTQNLSPGSEASANISSHSLFLIADNSNTTGGDFAAYRSKNTYVLQSHSLIVMNFKFKDLNTSAGYIMFGLRGTMSGNSVINPCVIGYQENNNTKYYVTGRHGGGSDYTLTNATYPVSGLVTIIANVSAVVFCNNGVIERIHTNNIPYSSPMYFCVTNVAGNDKKSSEVDYMSIQAYR